ncbi:MAG: 16S rRNA (cytidine(1402)-2'-O)-methyltransferase [Polyangiaceae bacterium UTPRO1]|jgi:16S rRNA (cytidine1402-2'-O)-methyltransferase|nr:16S rRNA (cytidine(1402)-2'-O)-methyltransferase [Myxococcales bacterium]OQY65162.1 MAG: 16S rRNA (cytidine(1402)-2'-O)-methyltransferase [Polyangiaceae bacterium UTPRO1]
MTGILYVVATPIGNLEDLTARARATLAAVDLVAAEDTRRTGRLLAHLGIRKPLRSYYDAVEAARAPALVAELAAGRSIALVSDAGTPGIADPGYRLIRAAIAAGAPVVPVPGPSALTAFLPVSGLPTDRFTFEGFLPARAAERRRRLTALAAEPRTLVCFETGPRLVAALADMVAAFGARPAAIGRELTKLHEEIVRGDLAALAVRAKTLVAKGEFVIGVAGAPASEPDRIDVDDTALADEVRRRRAAGASVRDVAAALARERGLNRRAVYRLVLALERA